jgi:site-specific DNA-methyltransferase (adenine-specific)
VQIIDKKISELIPYENNPRNNDGAVDAVANSIKAFGFKVPVVIDKDNVIVAGHTRLKAAKKLKLKTVPCVIADDLDENQIKAFRLADNKTGELALWDFDGLVDELADICNIDMSDFGFDFDDLNLNDDKVTVASEDNYDEELPEEPKAKLGDIYQLGEHRLICGDSTDADTISRLMEGKKAKILFTSPPYSDMREYNGGKDLSVSNIAKFIGAYKPYTDYQCVNLGIQRKDHEIVQYWDEYIAKARECGYKLLAWNVWDKMECGSIGQQSAFFPIRHEWIFVFGTDFYEINLTQQKKSKPITDKRSTTRRQKDGSLKKSTKGDQHHLLKQMESVLQLTPVKVYDIDHPAPFPVQLPAEYIKAMTDEGDSVIEPFGGSGTTMIACEQLNRKCYMCELDPRYVDVIIQRWEKFTGKKAILLNRAQMDDDA